MRHPYATVSKDSVTVYRPGAEPATIKKDHKNFSLVRERVSNMDFTSIEDLMVEGIRIANWSAGAFKFKDNHLVWEHGTLPQGLKARMETCVKEGVVPKNLMRFWEILQMNPDSNSVKQLFRFLRHNDVSIGSSGFIYAYKGVNNDYTDQHSGTFINKPGNMFIMARNQVENDPDVACKDGYHVGSMEYVKDFGSRVVLVRVHPKDVVSVPKDHNTTKMRCCRYEVIADWEKGKVLPLEFDDDEYWEDVPPRPEWWDRIPARIAESYTVVEDEAGKVGAAKPVFVSQTHEEALRKLLDNYWKWEDMLLKELRVEAKEVWGIKNTNSIKGGKPALIERMVKAMITEGDVVDEDMYAVFTKARDEEGQARNPEKINKKLKAELKAPGSKEEWDAFLPEKWAEMDTKSPEELLKSYTLRELRIYAKTHLGLLNVKAVRGGKEGLVILDGRFAMARKK